MRWREWVKGLQNVLLDTYPPKSHPFRTTYNSEKKNNTTASILATWVPPPKKQAKFPSFWCRSVGATRATARHGAEQRMRPAHRIRNAARLTYCGNYAHRKNSPENKKKIQLRQGGAVRLSAKHVEKTRMNQERRLKICVSPFIRFTQKA